MSVINKMLRDLDQRQASDAARAVGDTVPGRGTAALGEGALTSMPAGLPTGHHSRTLWRVLIAVLLLTTVGACAWWAMQGVTVPMAPLRLDLSPRTQKPALPGTSAAIAVPAAPAQVAVSTPTPVIEAPASAPPVRAASAAVPSANALREPVSLGLRMDTSLALRRLADRSPATDRPAASAAELPKPPTANDAIERAQVLWNSGSRDAAIELLQDAVAVAERGGASGNYPQGNPLMLPLVRELTRLQLAQARYGAVWDVLTRLEPQLGSAPDLWAIRGNAAQRLGRHQDSVHAYMVALQTRPNEQRWLLGAAVSLAALGQTSSAAEMAEKARAQAVVSPEVLTYLRQMGVPLKDK